MIKAIIIDDEQHCIDRLKSLLDTTCSDSIFLAGAFESVSEGYKAIKEIRPDLVFLDVQIQDKTGFDLLREIGQATFRVIFTTAYDKFAIEAFRFSALDYLLKPIDRDDLKAAVDKYIKASSVDHPDSRLDVLLHNVRSVNAISKRILVPTTSGFEVFEITDIIRCQSDINYTTIYLKNKQKLLVAKTLKEFEEMLTAYGFFRLHNSHLVNLSFIKSYNRGKGGSVILTDGTEIEVSTRRKDEFLQKMTQL